MHVSVRGFSVSVHCTTRTASEYAVNMWRIVGEEIWSLTYSTGWRHRAATSRQQEVGCGRVRLQKLRNADRFLPRERETCGRFSSSVIFNGTLLKRIRKNTDTKALWKATSRPQASLNALSVFPPYRFKRLGSGDEAGNSCSLSLFGFLGSPVGADFAK